MPTYTEPVTIKGPLTIDNPGDLTAFVLVGSGGQKLTVKYTGVGGDTVLTIPTPDGSSGQQLVLVDFPQTLRFKKLMSPKIETALFDRNGNEWLSQIAPPATVVNHLEIGNSGAGAALTLRAVGGDNNIPIDFVTKGIGALQIQGTNFLSISSGVLTFSLWALPTADGTNGQVIQTNGARVLSFATVGANHDMLSTTHPDATAGTVVRGDLIVGQAVTTTWQRLALGVSGRLLRSDGTDALWAQATLTTDVTGTLPVENGGTEATTFTSNGVIYGNGVGALLVTAQGGTNTVLIASAGAPSFSGQPTLATGIITKGQEAVRLDPFNTAAGNTGELRLLELAANGTNYVGFKAPDAIGVANPIWVLPAADVAGLFLSNGSLGMSIGDASLTADVSGVLPIANGGTNTSSLVGNRIMVSSSVGGSIGEAAVMTNGQLLIGSTAAAPVVAALTGTTNQITVTNGAGAITLATPQNIDTTATPQFLRLGLGAAASATANNRINLAASGNIVVADANPLHSIFVPATAMWPSTTAGSAALAKVELATNLVNFQSLDFDQTTRENAEFAVIMPDNYDAGTLTFKVVWTAASGAGGVAWDLQGTSLADDDAIDQAWGTIVTVTDTLIAANDCHITAESGALTLANIPAAGERVQFRIARQVAHASDTLTADARLLGVRIEYGVNAYSQ